MFFIIPLFQGVKYSFTDWNGIVPEIPFNFNKSDFEHNVLQKLDNPENRAYLKKYYLLSDSGETYNLTNWIQEKGSSRQLNDSEKRKIKRILAAVGISPIKFIGLKNYQQMFQNDERFVPRFEKKYLFNQFADLPQTIAAADFNKNILSHIKNSHDRSFIRSQYKKQTESFRLVPGLDDSQSEKLKNLLSQNWYTTIFIPGVIGFTLFFTLLNVIFSNLFALILALILDSPMRTKNILRSVFFFPNVLSLIIVAFIWSFVFRLIMPLVTGITVWLGSPELAPYALLMVTIWQGCGWLMIIYLAGLQTIPTDIMEGAQIDGANWWQRLRHITMPLLIPSFTICTFFSLSNSLKTFDVIMALTQGGPGYVTTPIVLDIYYNAFRDNQFGYATAKAVFLCMIIMIITGIQLYFMKKKEVEL
jgi:raffinose/stachyose/melibiose transport system permease protein